MSILRFFAAWFVLTLLPSTPVFALGKFSRACRWSDIPAVLRAPALDLFHIIGAAPAGKFNYLMTAPAIKQQSAFVLESLTVDWVSVRYNLYAENKVFEGWWSAENTYLGYVYMTSYQSDGWKAETIPTSVYNEPRLDIFFNNRGFLYSARAGHPEILQQFPDPYPGRAWKFMVVGQHAYYDFASGRTVSLGSSKASDCNLLEWGFENR
jgi:hypothetical protein